MPMPLQPEIRAVGVTDFRQFLNSPYLHYLQRVMKLGRMRDDAWEIDALGFGSLVHDVLERVGRSDCRDEQHSEAIEQFLIAQLNECARALYGERPLPAVRLQLQQLRRRLREFAQRQALEARKGWRIDRVEYKLEGAVLEIDGAKIEIHGRVDRIDRHEDGRRWRILDYKSGDDGVKPRKAHLNKSGWLDLQLPLYRHFLREELPGEIALGYFAIPRRLQDCGVHEVHFEAEELDGALDEARRILCEMRAGRFAAAGRVRPSDRVQLALCGLSLLTLSEDSAEEPGADDEESLE